MEIRKCVYNGPQFSLLEDLNALGDWRKLIGQPKTDKRYRDVELVLRVVALSHSWETYKKPMKGYLNGYLAELKNMKTDKRDSVISETNERMTQVFKYTFENLGEKPFHLFGRLNYAAMDSTLVAAHFALSRGVKDLKPRYDALVKDADFVELVTKDTSDEKILTNRIRRAITSLAG
jgi:hypothetical protein